MKYLNTNPNPAALLSSLRDIGYNVETAIEDLIDNSITAKSSRIEIQMIWNSDKPWVGILDDGIGMSSDELVKAMTLAGNNPLEKRDKDDLGRFGLGLKTASFSQCKELTVITFHDGKLSAAVLDLDVVERHSDKGFRVGILDKNDLDSLSVLNEKFPEFIHSRKGTLVLWSNMDRIDHFDNLKTRKKKFKSMSSNVKDRIQITFHRFMKKEGRFNKIDILFNKVKLEYIDPFNSDNLMTNELPEKTLLLKNEKITAQAYILPHHSVGAESYNKYALKGGYYNNQGLYIYRNRRLITRGNWLRLTHSSELTKLVRVRIDIPNNLDDILRVNVMKSTLVLPESLKIQLNDVLEQITGAGVEVYRNRAKRTLNNIKDPIWDRVEKHGKISYVINRDNHLISSCFESLSDKKQKQISLVFKTVENCFPINPFFNDLAKDPNDLQQTSISDDELTNSLEFFRNDLDTEKVSLELLLKIDPFASNKEQTKKLFEKLGYKL